MALIDAKVKTAKPKGKPYKLADSGGMYLLISANGSKHWRMRYRFAGEEKMLSIDAYPDVTPADTCEKRNEARKTLVTSGDLGEAKKEERIALQMSLKSTFEVAIREWHQLKADRWSLRYRDEVIDTSEKGIFLHIGKHPVAEIKPMGLLEALHKMKGCGVLGKMRKIRQRCGEVFRYVIVTGRAGCNPAPDLVSVLVTPRKVHFPFLTVNELPHFLDDLAGYTGSIITKTATQIIMLAGVRTQELCFARWENIDFETKLWEIPAEAMKMKRPHIVPLSEQVITLSKQLEPISKHHPPVFIGRSDPRKPISKKSVNQVIELLGYKGRSVGRDFRYTMSTILHEKSFNSTWIETQLAHVGKNAVHGTYSHAQYLNGRGEMMQ